MLKPIATLALMALIHSSAYAQPEPQAEPQPESQAHAVQGRTQKVPDVKVETTGAYSSGDSDSRYITLGHNVTQTANSLPAGRCTFGTTIAACGLGTDLTVGTSPWLWGGYNMYNLYTRWQFSHPANVEKAVQAAYFKTYSIGDRIGPSSPDGYDMESLWLYYIQSHKVSKEYTFHWNLQGAYYWNDRKPFSIRRPQVNKNPFQFNAMTLHEVHLIGNFVMQGEIGILGVTESWPALHSGVTFGYHGHSWAFQFGASATGPIGAWFDTTRYDNHALALKTPQGSHQDFTDEQMSRDFSIHPEIALQWVVDFL
jgi:hypothetical protein